LKHLSQLFTRVFTKSLEGSDQTVYDLFDWQRVDVSLTDYRTGKISFEMHDLEFPKGYSQNACNIIASKYFRKEGVPEGGHESSMRQVADRMVGFWADALRDEGLIATDEQWQIFYDEMVFAFLSQMWAPNSPQWFNTGIRRNYGIDADSDSLYYYDEKAGRVVQSKDRYTRTQSSACFILSIKDQLLGKGSISDHYVSETKLFKGGSGVGSNFSPLRGEGEGLSSGGKSSGMMSFLQGLDRNAGAIKSGGTTRRAAKMVIVDIDHPEIESFINWKAHEEQKVRDLGKMGYDTSMDGEAYQTVSGQNANNSVRLNRDFVEKVMHLDDDPDAEIELTGRVDDRVNRKVPVRKLWREINEAAWACADPGLQFDNLFNDWHTCPAGEDGQVGAKHNRINATNPCSEYAFLDDTACNLASINVYRFAGEDGSYDLTGFTHLVALTQLVLEASIHWGQFPTEEVARKTYQFRTTGLGLANLASLLLSMGLPYDSDEARAVAASLAGIMTGVSYATSALMAEKQGPFPCYSLNAPYMGRVIRNHARVAGARDDAFEELDVAPMTVDHAKLAELGLSDWSGTLKNAWLEAEALGREYGYRNAQVSVIAPTGTISFAMDCGATSIEPFYSHVVLKKLIGGGAMEIVNPVLETGLRHLGYPDDQVQAIMDYILEKDDDGHFLHTDLKSAPYLKPEDLPVFDCAGDIRPEGHVLMVAAITPMISGSVSKTVNLPHSATVEDIAAIHLLAYRSGVKAIATYRDGCKASQPMTTGDHKEHKRALNELRYDELLDLAENGRKVLERKKPKGIRNSRTHAAKIGDIELYITVSFYDNDKISEIFVSTDREGTVVKGLLASLSKSISHMLQYGIDPEDISAMLRGQKYEPSGLVLRHPYIKSASSISDLISKVIDIECGDYSRCQVKPDHHYKRSEFKPTQMEMADLSYADDAEDDDAEQGERLYGEVCPSCGSDRMVRNGTCKVCLDCGSTTGCS
jgi:ribonucleoside-diphosphate reductase alpha chain